MNPNARGATSVDHRRRVEARLLAAITERPSTVLQLAIRTNMSPEQVRTMLDPLVRQGKVLAQGVGRGKMGYWRDGG